ncbi:MAG: hypothetical protein R2941_17150 [Desulfobacterales bacterium]
MGKVEIGGGSAVAVQSILQHLYQDIAATVAQIHRLEEAGMNLIGWPYRIWRLRKPLPESKADFHSSDCRHSF